MNTSDNSSEDERLPETLVGSLLTLSFTHFWLSFSPFSVESLHIYHNIIFILNMYYKESKSDKGLQQEAKNY